MKRWEELPENMRTEAVRPYYDYLCRHRAALAVKRVFDVAVSAVLFLVLLPFMFIIGILVGTTSRGGVFFCQDRVTTYGRHFRIIKFRTMTADAGRTGSLVTVKDDARVTKVGRFLRKVRLDELPQLINILKGDMSIVGTRPEVPRYVERYTPEMMATLLMPAGVTSRASIEYKDEEKLLTAAMDVDAVYVEAVLPEKMKYNLEYMMKFSIAEDLRLMVQTVGAVLRN